MIYFLNAKIKKQVECIHKKKIKKMRDLGLEPRSSRSQSECPTFRPISLSYFLPLLYFFLLFINLKIFYEHLLKT